MTLCIAAVCQERGAERIVIAADWRAEGYVAGADIQDKLYWVGDDIAVLISGTITRAVELKDTIVQYVENCQANNLPAIKAADLCDFFRVAVVAYKQKLVSEYVGLKFGLGYQDFLQAVGLKQIPDNIAADSFEKIKEIALDCCLLICLFDKDRRAHVLKIEDDGTLEIIDSFAAIGSGSPIAEGVLFQREHTSDDTVGTTIYQVYEAMKLGSIAPGVGKEFTIDVLRPPDREHEHTYGQLLNPKGLDFMESQFKKRGPKKFSNFVRLPPGIFDVEFED